MFSLLCTCSNLWSLFKNINFVVLKLDTQPRLGNHNNYIKTHHFLFIISMVPPFLLGVLESPLPSPATPWYTCITIVASTTYGARRNHHIQNSLCIFNCHKNFIRRVLYQCIDLLLSLPYLRQGPTHCH